MEKKEGKTGNNRGRGQNLQNILCVKKSIFNKTVCKKALVAFSENSGLVFSIHMAYNPVSEYLMTFRAIGDTLWTKGGVYTCMQ